MSKVYSAKDVIVTVNGVECKGFGTGEIELIERVVHTTTPKFQEQYECEFIMDPTAGSKLATVTKDFG